MKIENLISVLGVQNRIDELVGASLVSSSVLFNLLPTSDPGIVRLQVEIDGNVEEYQGSLTGHSF